MKKILFFSVCIMLAACGTKKSNSAKIEENGYAEEVSTAIAEPEMTPEEQVIAYKFSVARAEYMGDGYFKVARNISSDDLDSLVYNALGEEANCRCDELTVWGVVDSCKWVVPAIYQTVERSLGYGAFVVSYTEWVHDWSGEYEYCDKDGQIRHLWRHQKLFAVYYNGKTFAGWDICDNFEPVTYHSRLYGAMNKFGDDEDCSFEWYPVSNTAYNNYLYVENGSHPFYTSYEVKKDGCLYMWNKYEGESFAEARANRSLPQSEKSLLIWDLFGGKTVYDPFVPVD